MPSATAAVSVGFVAVPGFGSDWLMKREFVPLTCPAG
jgi:hypothetical protein